MQLITSNEWLAAWRLTSFKMKLETFSPYQMVLHLPPRSNSLSFATLCELCHFLHVPHRYSSSPEGSYYLSLAGLREWLMQTSTYRYSVDYVTPLPQSHKSNNDLDYSEDQGHHGVWCHGCNGAPRRQLCAELSVVATYKGVLSIDSPNLGFSAK
jgi:hypothetical protein